MRLGVFGVGLIGGSIALAARAAGAHVAGADRDPAVLARARERGALDETAPDLATLAAGCDVLVLAVDVDATLDALAALRATPPRAALILDVASVKAPVVAAAAGIAGFVATHPIAGSERGGIDAADAALFAGAAWAIVPGEPAPTARAATLVESWGARAVAVDAVAHDAIVARTSHLPQVLAWALAAEIESVIAAEPRAARLTGPGLRTTLRLARSPWPLWETILRANRVDAAAALRSLATRLVQLADAVEAGDLRPLASHSASGERALAALDAADRERSASAVRSPRYRRTEDDAR